MKIICKADDCFGCLACVNICPQKCIDIAYDNQGFIIPNIDENICINCNRCIKVCPVNNNITLTSPIEVYAGQMNDYSMAQQSTSGGMFQICKHSKKCTFYTLRFGCSFAAVNTIKPQLL